MITVKDVNGTEKNVASRGLAGTALGLGAGALGWQLLNGGGCGLFNNGTANNCYVTESQFYETELANRDREFANYNALNDKFCALAQRVAVDETAIAYQNKLFDKQFECVDKQFGWERLVSNYEIDAKTCHCIKGNVFASPADIADPYHGVNLQLGRAIPNNYCSNFYDNGCGCGC